MTGLSTHVHRDGRWSEVAVEDLEGDELDRWAYGLGSRVAVEWVVALVKALRRAAAASASTDQPHTGSLAVPAPTPTPTPAPTPANPTAVEALVAQAEHLASTASPLNHDVQKAAVYAACALAVAVQNGCGLLAAAVRGPKP